jgi:hypothetical protein
MNGSGKSELQNSDMLASIGLLVDSHFARSE